MPVITVPCQLHTKKLTPITLFFFLIAPLLLPAQHTPEAQKIIQTVLQSQQQLQRVSYTIRVIRGVDTFTTGDVWNHTGHCDLVLEPTDSLFGFSFRGNRDDVKSEMIYTGRKAFQLNTEKHTYTMSLQPGKGIMGSPGGQMVFPDLIKLDTSRALKTNIREDDGHYILRFDYPDNSKQQVEQSFKLVFIDKKRMLPVRVYKHLVHLGKQQVVATNLQTLSVNGEVKIPFDFAGKKYLEGYTLQVSTNDEPLYLSLLNKKAPELRLKDLNGNTIAVSALAGKVVLLDFWEVWCNPCVASMPKVEALHAKYKDKGLVVMGIMCDSSLLEPAKRLIAKNKYTFSQLIGNDHIQKDYKLEEIPLYVLIDKAGNISYIHAGYEETLEEQIRKALE